MRISGYKSSEAFLNEVRGLGLELVYPIPSLEDQRALSLILLRGFLLNPFLRTVLPLHEFFSNRECLCYSHKLSDSSGRLSIVKW